MMTKLRANEIIRLLEEPTKHRYSIKKQITEEATGNEVVKALQQATNPLTREILCGIAGDRFDKAAVPILIQLLRDPSVGVRAGAADALGKIGDPAAGPAIFERFAGAEQVEDVKELLASALGAVGYRPAIPLLIQTLEKDNEVLRGCAAWALGIMCATEAEEALYAILARESKPPGSYIRERLSESVEALKLANIATTSMRREEAIRILLAALKRKPFVGVNTVCAAWALGKLKAKEAEQPLERLLIKYPRGFLAEHIRAALQMIRGTEL